MELKDQEWMNYRLSMFNVWRNKMNTERLKEKTEIEIMYILKNSKLTKSQYIEVLKELKEIYEAEILLGLTKR